MNVWDRFCRKWFPKDGEFAEQVVVAIVMFALLVLSIVTLASVVIGPFFGAWEPLIAVAIVAALIGLGIVFVKAVQR